MSVSDVLTLSADVLIIPVADLPQAVRDELGEEGAFAVTRARGRFTSLLVDEATAELLDEFRSPSTIVDAVIRLSRRLDADPETVLEDSYPILRQFLAGGHLVVADDPDGGTAHTLAFAVGESVAGGVVVRCMRALEDTELYQLALPNGGLAALKVVRAGMGPQVSNALRREADVLSLIDGRLAPRLLAEGETNANSWLRLEWCEGSPISVAAATLRRSGGPGGALLQLCVRVVEAFGALHELGIVHGDVHPANLIASSTGEVRLLDFGLARRIRHAPHDEPTRGGVLAFFDPQYAAAVRAADLPPVATFGSDQYSLGAILYLLVTGAHYLEFSLDKEEMLRQIVEDRPLPFTRRGHPPWPALEAVLGAALAKDPGDRFASTAELARRLASVADQRRAAEPGRPVRNSAVLEKVLEEVVAQARPGGEWFEQGLPSSPRCSVAYGAAGLAVALCRVGILRADPELVTLADEWVVRAAREAGEPGAFTSEVLQIDESQTGLTSPFHRLSGVHAVQALVSHAVRDTLARQKALDLFVEESRQPCGNLDLTLGRSGTVLAAAILLEAIDGTAFADTSTVIELGNETLAGIWAELDGMPPIAEGGPVSNLGIAHGWAGFLLATLRWCRVTGAAPPLELDSRLAQLGELAQWEGVRARWPWVHHPAHSGPVTSMPGWCNGSAGFVHLWTTAHAVLGDDRWEVLGEGASWDAYTSHSQVAQLCCGLSGQAYALLEMYRHSGQNRWLTAASEVATRAAAGRRAGSMGRLIPGSLHKGDVGIGVLAADLADPEEAVMPFFGADL